MMRAKGKATFLDAMKETTSPVSPAAAAVAKEALKEDEWEVRPGGMLVQKRGPDSDAPAGAPVPTIRLKVKFNGVSHEIYINSQASFGNARERAEEDDVGQDRAAPRGPEGALQEQGDGLQGLPRHVRRQGPLQAGAARGPRRAGQAPHRAAPHRQGPARRQVHLPHQPRRRQARHQGVRAADHRRQGREGGGGRRGRPHRGAHDGAGQAGRHRRRRRGQGAAANAGEAGAEVRGDAGRHPRQEHGQRPRPRQERGGAKGQRQRQWPSQGRPVAAPAAAAAARVAAAAVQAAVRPGDRQGSGGAAHGELGDVRPAVVNAVDVLGHGDHHHGSRDHHDEAGRQQQHLADPAVRLGALLATTRVPPVTAWYMASLIPFSCIHQINRPLSALLNPIRSDPIRPI